MERVSPNADDLSALLRTVDVRSAVYCLSDLGEPWGFRVDASAEAKFHVVLTGAATLTVARRTVELSAGDVVLLPRGTAHAIRGARRARVPRLGDVLATHPLDATGRLTYGGDGARTRLLCGAFEVQRPAGDVLGLTPPTLVLESRDVPIGSWVEPMFALLREETEEPAPGAAAVFGKIADVFLTHLVRQYLAGTDGRELRARLAASADTAVSEAVRLLHARPEAPWTVAGLARQVGMSRTAFAARFREVVGEPPMTYVTKLRLSQGAGHLATTTKGVAHVARTVGYASEASFSKAFKRVYGVYPGAYRRHARTVDP